MDNGKANGTDEHKAPSFSARDDDSSRTNRRSRAKDFEGIEDSSELEKMWDQLDAKVLRGVSKVQDDDWKNEESKLVTLRMEKLTKDITKLNELYWQNCSDFVALHGGDRIKLLNNNLAMAKECRKNKVLSKLIQELNDKHQQMWALKQRKAELAETDDI